MLETTKALTIKYIDLLRSLCLIETPSSFKESIDEMVDLIENFALTEGYKTERIPFANAGDFLLIKSNCHLEEKSVMLMAHMDTVHKKGAFGEQIIKIDGLSGHADYQEMMQYISCQPKENIKHTFLVHGDYEAECHYKTQLHEAGWKHVSTPAPGDEFEL